VWNAVLPLRDYDGSVEQHETVESMRRRLAVEGPTFTEHVRRVSEDGRLDETFVDAPCTPADVFTHGGVIAHVLTFDAHRRTLMAGALIDARHGPGRRRPAPVGRAARCVTTVRGVSSWPRISAR
jgi:hypothetical protein